MVGKKGKGKGKTTGPVAQGVMSAPVFTAVPQSRAVSATMPAGGSAPSQRPRASSPPRILGHPESPRDEFSEPESSLFDYQQIDELGYSKVNFGTWPNRDRQRKGGNTVPPQFRYSGSVGHYAEPGDLEGFGDPDSARGGGGDISDLYATPMKKGKGRGKSSTRSSTGSHLENDIVSMTATHKNVQAEMQRIHDLPEAIDDTMVKSVRHNAHISHTFPGSGRQVDSGRGSSRPDSLMEDPEEENTEAPGSRELSPDLLNMSDRTANGQRNGVHNALQDLEARPGEDVEEESGHFYVNRKGRNVGLVDNETIENLIKASSATSSQQQAKPTRARSARSRTPRSARELSTEMEFQQLKLQNEEMQAELSSLRKVAEAIRDGDIEGAQTLYVRRQMEDLKEENETLKTSVHRLNVELSDYQAKYRPVDPNHVKKVIEVNGLPSKGPVPSWLINKRYLAPLYLAYDDHIEEKNKLLEDSKNELASLRKRAEEILKENQRLRMMGGPGLSGAGDTSEWQQLQEQARLVLEENQVLMEQLEVQTSKAKDMYTAHMAEISRLAKKLAISEGEKADTEREVEEVRVRFKEMKHKHDQIVMESGARVDVHSHINTLADLKRSVTEEKEQYEREVDSIRVKLQASEQERKSQAMQMVDITAENKRLKAEVKTMQKSVKHAQQKMTVLHRAIELSEDKEMITQEQLANVIKVAEKTALERDTVYKVAREQQEENKMTVNKMMLGSVAVGKLEEKLKLYRMKASAKINTVADRMKEQDEAFVSQKKEYDREIQYLRLLLKEKEEIIQSLESDKKEIEKDLDTMWQAANSENKRVKNILLSGGRKLKDNVHIADALKEELETEERLHFSDSEYDHE
ncbi:centrosomal protein of 89 kDa isoform X1 [Aplysia californica]|uniref:Centrosomal protein of 89 kDa isoform X1 n=1 Tax=Aplysia californica TaxID=6500 RepID=A0ABM0JCJ4_APLCA|nr:centrosomal protein of 89 kDa isoform X1 [Aplysia californica]